MATAGPTPFTLTARSFCNAAGTEGSTKQTHTRTARPQGAPTLPDEDTHLATQNHPLRQRGYQKPGCKSRLLAGIPAKPLASQPGGWKAIETSPATLLPGNHRSLTAAPRRSGKAQTQPRGRDSHPHLPSRSEPGRDPAAPPRPTLAEPAPTAEQGRARRGSLSCGK